MQLQMVESERDLEQDLLALTNQNKFSVSLHCEHSQVVSYYIVRLPRSWRTSAT